TRQNMGDAERNLAKDRIDFMRQFERALAEAKTEDRIKHVREIVEKAKKKEVKEIDLVAEIERLTRGYPDDKKGQYMVDKLAENYAKHAGALWGKEVIVRTWDDTDKECRMMAGNLHFEEDAEKAQYYFPPSRNPLISVRGGSLYTDPKHEPWFRLNLEAIYTAKFIYGFHNIKVMFPFIQSLDIHERLTEIDKEERTKVLEKANEMGIPIPDEIAKEKPYNMLETPAHGIVADRFSKDRFGFSIGSNDATALLYGFSRDDYPAPPSDERGLAARRFFEFSIDYAQRNNMPIGWCGNAPGQFEEYPRLLAKWKIEKASVTPDRFLEVSISLAEAERAVAMDERLGVTTASHEREKVLRLVDREPTRRSLSQELGFRRLDEPENRLVKRLDELDPDTLKKLQQAMDRLAEEKDIVDPKIKGKVEQTIHDRTVIEKVKKRIKQ
ncbi:putative PEP-binding protein, partial [Candidatus Altiarchaeota archaeon]